MAISQITVFCFYEPVLSFDSQAVRQAANPLVVLSPNDQQNYEVSRSMMARRSLGVAAKARITLLRRYLDLLCRRSRVLGTRRTSSDARLRRLNARRREGRSPG